MKDCRIIICGGRDFRDRALFEQSLDSILKNYEDFTFVSGHAKGADTFAEEYARVHSIPVNVFKPDWKRYGKGAGPVRNREMLAFAAEKTPVIIAFWDGKSKGTQNMLREAKELNAVCHLVMYEM
ncbi:MAG: DUF2493 domain-containing protein [Eubacteriales bacterium]|nr:DUF2493 domain-containing protein [Eubacteriales bacterium]